MQVGSKVAAGGSFECCTIWLRGSFLPAQISQRTDGLLASQESAANSSGHLKFGCETASHPALTADMADKTPKEPQDPIATRIDPAKEPLTPEQMHFIRQVEREQWKKKTQMLRGRNAVTGLAIGALVLGIYGYTFYSVSQEKIMDELDEEAKRARMQGRNTGAN